MHASLVAFKHWLLSHAVFKPQVVCSPRPARQVASASLHHVSPTLPSSGLAKGQPHKANVMPLSFAIERSETWMVKCAALVDAITFAASNRGRVSVSLHHLCVEHHTGIHTLVEQGVYGSAFALFRPQFEAYVRGAWYHFCASESQLNKFLKGSDPPPINTLIAELEGKGGFDGGSLSRMKSQVWSNLNDFTHGGVTQVKARNTRDEIVQNYQPEHVVGLLTSSATMALLAGVGIAAVTNNDALAVRLRNEYRSVYEAAA